MCVGAPHLFRFQPKKKNYLRHLGPRRQSLMARLRSVTAHGLNQSSAARRTPNRDEKGGEEEVQAGESRLQLPLDAVFRSSLATLQRHGDHHADLQLN